jgi:hypothetical protein
MLTPDAQPYDADAPSSAAAGVSPAGTAAALSVAGVRMQVDSPLAHPLWPLRPRRLNGMISGGRIR